MVWDVRARCSRGCPSLPTRNPTARAIPGCTPLTKISAKGCGLPVGTVLVVSRRGGDLILDGERDSSIGYLWHNAELVTRYPEQRGGFGITEPGAAAVLTSR